MPLLVENRSRYARTRKREQLLFMLLFPVVTVYYELIFKLSTVGGFWSWGTLFTVLFSTAFGGIAYLLASIARNEKVNRGISIAFLAVGAVIFLVEYFVYREFKIFYDINTVTNGANDVVEDFLGEIFRLVFSVNGIFRIVLFALPTVLYCVFGSVWIPARSSNAAKRILVAMAAVACFLIGLLGVHISPLSAKYRAEYTFQDAVGNFGLYTGIRLDLRHLIFGHGNADFDIQDGSDVVSDPQVPEEEKPEEYGYNALDIDFTALAAGASQKLADLDAYVSSLTPSKKNPYTGIFKGKNLIMISAEAFTAEVIDEQLTPTLYRLATKGIRFTDYYQPASAGTTGGEYQNLLGFLPMTGGRSFRDCIGHNLYYSMGNQLNRLGYYGKAFHNNTYTYYDRDKTHINLGYSDGYMGYGNGMEQYVENHWPQSDLEMMAGTLPTYIDKQPFNVYYMSVSGHGNYSQSGNYQTGKNWSRVENIQHSDPVKGYLACNLVLEDALASVVATLEEKGIADDTVICISADHFPYSLDANGSLGNMPYLSELYGYNVTTNIQRDHNRLILWCGSLEDQEPIEVSSPTFSLDIVPTLSNLFGTEFDSRMLPGRDVLSDAEALIFNTGYDWKTDLGTYISATGRFTPTDPDAVIPDGYIDRIKAIVRNKIKFCADAPATDYYAHVFGAQ